MTSDEFTEKDFEETVSELDDTSSLVDNDEITPEEEGILRGYEEADGSLEEESEEEL